MYTHLKIIEFSYGQNRYVIALIINMLPSFLPPRKPSIVILFVFDHLNFDNTHFLAAGKDNLNSILSLITFDQQSQSNINNVFCCNCYMLG